MTNPLDDFCGSTFWDLNQTWFTDDPDFTECFHQTVLIWVPCAWLWVLSPFMIINQATSRARDIPWNPFNISKTVISALLICLEILDLAYAIYRSSDGRTVYAVSFVAPSIMIATLTLALGLLLADRKRGIRSSGYLFIFWFLLALCNAFTYRTRITSAVNDLNDENTFQFVWYMLYYPLVVAMLFINGFSDKEPDYNPDENVLKNPSPEEGASFLSKMIYQWYDTMAWRGYRRPLEMNDLWDLNSRDRSAQVVPRFDKEWQKSRQKHAAKVQEYNAQYSAFNGNVDIKEKTVKEPKKLVSVLPSLWKVFGPSFSFGAFLKLIADLLAFVSPQILRLLIAFVSSDDSDWKGYMYAAIMFITALLQTVITSQYFQNMFVVGMQVRTSVVSAIYRKALLISNSARKESTVGEIVNLMSVDAQRLMDLTSYLNLLWSAPLQIALAIYFLYDILGPSVFAGLGVMILLIPINGVFANVTKKLQIKQMQNKDKRVKLMNEILSGMKVLKLYAWEPSFQNQVEDIRNKEVQVLKQAAYLNAGTMFIWTCAPFLVSLVTFMTYVLVDPANILDPEKAFVSLTLFNIMRMPMSLLPLMIVYVVQVALASFATHVLFEDVVLNSEKVFVSVSLFNVIQLAMFLFPTVIISATQAGVSIKRLNKFLNADELDINATSHDEKERDPIVVEKGTFSWAKDEDPVLKNINLSVRKGQLVAVVGQVGTGKSSLVSAILGEMEKVSGRINTKGRLAYVPQQAWIQNCSLKNNILFGYPLDEGRYTKVVESCALKQDLAMLPGGDATEIGEKGINLSGGQKQRVSLARAVYCDMDVYLLDDPLSAVDSHVGKHIFDNVIGPQGMLQTKTRILVTHGITYLPQVDQIFVLKDGEISESGSYKELLARKGDFAEFLLQHIDEESEEADEGISQIKQELESSLGKDEVLRQISRQRSQLSESHSETEAKSSTQRRISAASSTTSFSRNNSVKRRSIRSNKSLHEKEKPQVNLQQNDKLIEAEKAETGKVKPDVYLHYLRSVGGWMSFWSLFLYAVYQAFSMLSNVWLSAWSEDPRANETNVRDLYLGVYGALGFGQALFTLIASMTMALGTLSASKLLQSQMLAHVMRSPMSFFDTTPIGRIVNRFAKDVDTVDNILPMSIRTWLNCLYSVLATVIIISAATPIFLAVVIPIGIIYYWLQHVYVATSRQLKRLESVSRSPIYSHFGETITGASVIRAYQQQQRFILESEHRVDINQVCYYPSIIANRWLSVRLETVGNLVVLFAALFAVIGRDTIDPGLVGLSVSYALNVTQTLNWFMRMTSEVETNIVAVERIKEYCQTPQEASWDYGKVTPARDWPQEGRVSFQNYQVRYREGLELVLKGITCDIQGGEKVGIVGRTGAGKSSLTLSLFRIIEAAGGAIVIDGVNIAELGLRALRSKLTIIPQDPVLFSGTLRINLDPFNEYKDEEVWRALEHAHLKGFVKTLSAGLEHEVSEGGENLSVGQRQLICLARALLRKTKVLILDEATAAVDLETDDLIQETIRREFKACTVITIAHRLNTIMDSNRVLVLDKGEIREFDTPSNLLAQKSSIFYGMAHDAGLV